ncbi:MAG TPA: response regulator [Aliidongia sp.]|uniref:response regulator n=1 Tax=Aliidongia sp. TaxID=1914230 RepID=UPI002DDD215F|nr:response regulator [Aliidongia sp.]HEV2674298.1 response regulator [Aliidongia sp.]
MSDDAQILVLDDDPAIRTLVRRCLEPGGFRVEAATDGADLRRLLGSRPIDLVILDLNLRGEDGLDHLKALRAERDLPVIILTGRGEPIDRATGLELGADDYVAKPFEPRELLARVRTVLRRTGRRASPSRIVAIGPWKLDLDARSLLAGDGAQVALTSAQFAILSVLATHPNRVLTRDQILDLADQGAKEPFDRSIDAHIVQLRRKIERDPRQPEFIKTVYGAGYIFRAG